MIKFTETVTINQSQEVIFDFTQDYANRLNWDTFLRKASLINGATAAGRGVKAYCVAKNGLVMETEYVSFNRPKVTAIKIDQRPLYVQSIPGFLDIQRNNRYANRSNFPLFIQPSLSIQYRKRLYQNEFKMQCAPAIA